MYLNRLIIAAVLTASVGMLRVRAKDGVVVSESPPQKQPKVVIEPEKKKPEPKKPVPKNWVGNPLGELVAPVNRLGYGRLSGRVQFLTVYDKQDRPDEYGNLKPKDVSSGTLGFELKYRSSVIKPFRFGLEYLYCAELFDGGSLDDPNGGGWATLNDDYHLLSEAYAEVNLGIFGLEKTVVRAGRYKATYDFFPSYDVFQKSQYIQGVMLKFNEIDKFSLELGHIEKFSSWSGRMGSGDWFRADFNNVEDIINNYLLFFRQWWLTPPYQHVDVHANDGMQYIHMSTTAIPRLYASAYDLYGNNLYNTFGMRAHLTLSQGEGWNVSWNNHYSTQKDDGSLGYQIDSEIIESSLSFRKGRLSIEPGIISNIGRNDQRAYFLHPFESNISVWETNGHNGGSDTYYLRTTYDHGRGYVQLLGMFAQQEDYIHSGQEDYQIKMIYTYWFRKNFMTSVKAVWGEQKRGNAEDPEKLGFRFFLTYYF